MKFFNEKKKLLPIHVFFFVGRGGDTCLNQEVVRSVLKNSRK